MVDSLQVRSGAAGSQLHYYELLCLSVTVLNSVSVNVITNAMLVTLLC